MSSIPDDPVDLVEHISMCTPPSGVRIALLQQDTPPERHERHDGIAVGWVGVVGVCVGSQQRGRRVEAYCVQNASSSRPNRRIATTGGDAQNEVAEATRLRVEPWGA